MRELQAIRNWLTHPRNAEDLHLTDEELTHVIAATDWFKQTMLGMFDACALADRMYQEGRA